MTPLMFRVLGYLLTGLFVITLAQGFLAKRDQRLQTEAVAAQGLRTDAAVSGMVEDIGTFEEAAVVEETGIAAGREQFQYQYREALKNDPIARSWADAPIPDRLREQARQRRLARERLGCAGDWCGDDGADAPASR